jgi:hypothetical protein
MLAYIDANPHKKYVVDFSLFVEKNKEKFHPNHADIQAIEGRARQAREVYKTARDEAHQIGEMRVTCESFHEAKQRAMELMGIIPNGSNKVYVKAKFDPHMQGKRVGFTAEVLNPKGSEFRSFRFDNDPQKGPHINVVIRPSNVGKNDQSALNIAFEFEKYPDEERELVPRMVELMGMHHGYIQQQV